MNRQKLKRFNKKINSVPKSSKINSVPETSKINSVPETSTKSSFDYVDAEYRKKYEETFGINSSDTSIKKYSKQQQIERYAKNIFFWICEKVNVSTEHDLTEKNALRLQYLQVTYSMLLEKIHSQFNSDMKTKIYKKVEELAQNDPQVQNEKEGSKKRLAFMLEFTILINKLINTTE